jgi:hypothetical protein
MLLVKRGITRTVLLTRRYAIKFPSLRPYGDGFAGLLWSISRGILANQSEAQWWKHSPLEQKRAMCPVLLSWGGLVNVYPRCEPFVVSEELELAMFHREFFPVHMDPAPGDNKPDNYGVLNGQIVFLDYDMNYNGCPHDRSGFLNQGSQKDDRQS